jgi:GNAT superfamily N-acetyltransferase
MNAGAHGSHLEIREGTAADVPLLWKFFRSMAEFERLPFTATEESLREALFDGIPAAHTLLVSVDGEPAAYAVYYFTFSTMVGKRGLWLEDIYVEPQFRGRHIGQALMRHLAGIAIANACGRFEWATLEWNEPAIRFYKRLGASLLGDFRTFRLDESQLARVAMSSG